MKMGMKMRIQLGIKMRMEIMMRKGDTNMDDKSVWKKGAENRVLPQGSCHSMSTASEFKIVGNKPEKIHPNLGF